jgi:hypothetical protein
VRPARAAASGARYSGPWRPIVKGKAGNMDENRLAQFTEAVREMRRFAKERDDLQDSLPIGPTGFPTFTTAQFEEWVRLHDLTESNARKVHELLLSL